MDGNFFAYLLLGWASHPRSALLEAIPLSSWHLPLLEEEGNARRQAPISHLSRPGGVHGPGPGAGLAAHDHPVDPAQVKVGHEIILSGIADYIFAYVPASKAIPSAERDRSATPSSDTALQQVIALLQQQKEIYENKIERLTQ